jgi:hypothetical protein
MSNIGQGFEDSGPEPHAVPLTPEEFDARYAHVAEKRESMKWAAIGTAIHAIGVTAVIYVAYRAGRTVKDVITHE